MRNMTDISITSEPAQPPAKSTAPKTKKRKMNAAQRKALSVAAKARWAAKKTAPASSEVDRIDYYSSGPDGTFIPVGSGPVASVKISEPVSPSPAVLVPLPSVTVPLMVLHPNPVPVVQISAFVDPEQDGIVRSA